MFEHVFAAYHRFAKWTSRSTWSRRSVSLAVVALEERATPAATPTFTPLAAAPQAVLVAPITTPTPAVGNGSLTIPMAGQSMVRLDLIAPGESAPGESVDDAANLLVQHRQKADAPPVTQSNADDVTVNEEELAEMFAASSEA